MQAPERKSLMKAAGHSQLGCWLVCELEAGPSRSPCPNLTGSDSGELWGECPRLPRQALLGKEGRSEERKERFGGSGGPVAGLLPGPCCCREDARASSRSRRCTHRPGSRPSLGSCGLSLQAWPQSGRSPPEKLAPRHRALSDRGEALALDRPVASRGRLLVRRDHRHCAWPGFGCERPAGRGNSFPSGPSGVKKGAR